MGRHKKSRYKELTIDNIPVETPRHVEDGYTVVKLEGYIAPMFEQATLNADLLELHPGTKEYEKALQKLTEMEEKSRIRFDLSPNRY